MADLNLFSYLHFFQNMLKIISGLQFQGEIEIILYRIQYTIHPEHSGIRAKCVQFIQFKLNYILFNNSLIFLTPFDPLSTYDSPAEGG